MEYERGGITFYIMNNLTRKTVAWLDGNISGSFSGELTVEECQDIIDSIPPTRNKLLIVKKRARPCGARPLF